MSKYWSAAALRLAPLAGVIALVTGTPMLAALIVEDRAPWPSALAQSTLAGLTCGVLSMLILATADAVSAARTAARFGLSLESAAAQLPSVRRLSADTPGVTAFQLADSALHAIRNAQTPVTFEVVELGHGRVSLTCESPSGHHIQVSIDITVVEGRAVAVITCRPTASRQRLDNAWSWAIGGALEPHVRAALNDG